MNNNDAIKKKMGTKTFVKNPINGTKYTIAISSAKGGVGKSTFASNIAIPFEISAVVFNNSAGFI